MKVRAKLVSACALTALFVAPSVFATNGYFPHGHGIRSKSMGGVGIALPEDALAAADNPAGMVWVGNRIDFGVDWFRPVRNTQLNRGPGPFGAEYSGSDDQDFLIPEFGYNRMLNANSSLGVSVYAHGGMNTSYTDLNTATSGLIFGQGKLGVDLMQLFISPTYSLKVSPNHSLGVSLNFAYQRFKADGIQNFDNPFFSSAPGSVSNNGYDSSTGWGLRVGWLGQISPGVSVGATYQSKTRMGKFDKYRGLFAEQGGFDIPENYGVGIAVKATPKMTIAADLQRINYSKIKSIGNSGNIPALLGTDNGPGFGWRDMTVLKLGASYALNDKLTLRGGLSHGNQPIPDTETFFNVLAPGVIENHVTLGATWTLANKSELTVGYMHAFKKTVNGTGPTAGFNLNMYQDSLGVTYGWKM
ncbi:MAG TPA: outer membrane protein transport protein [Burkholderiales bacterium]|nr:outer membrane protein transport protein [Burkholderiales bacterium]